MEAINQTTIKKEILVEASQQTAFEVFTQQMGQWWPTTHHIGKSPMTDCVLEPTNGGRWYSRHDDGSEADNGYVLNWDPYARVVLAWQIDGDFQYKPDLITEVEINFIPESPEQTRVTLEHRNLDKLAGGVKVISSMDEGWGFILNLYKKIADEA
jgi:uncharacterized protein YndB with AHSA1/START domain